MGAILQDVNAELAALRAENAALKASRTAITYKVSGKNAISAYGLGQFPVTLYAEQWDRLDADIDQRKAFIKANDKIIAKKGQAPTAEMVAHSKAVEAVNKAKEEAKAKKAA